MTQDGVLETDVLYVLESIIRKQILQYLSGHAQDYLSISQLARSINQKSGNVNFHCDELHKRGLVDIQKTRRKYVRITQKGLLVLRELEQQNKRGQ